MTKKIIYIQYTNPACYPSLEHSSQMLAKNGWRVLFLGTGSFGASNMLCFSKYRNIILRKLTFRNGGLRQKLHYLIFCAWVVARTFLFKPSYIYASDPFSCPVALILSYLPGVRIIYHEHDATGIAGTTGRVFFDSARFMLWARRRAALRAILCVTPNSRRAELLSETSGRDKDIYSVLNCPKKSEALFGKSKSDKRIISAAYHGTIVPGRVPLKILEAVALLPENVNLKVIGFETVGSIGYMRQLKEAALRLGINERVEFISPFPLRRDVLSYLQGCDIGISLMPGKAYDVNEITMAGASNKPFDYMACGLALLVSDLPDWQKMYVEPGYSLACNPEDPEDIARVLRWFLEHPEETRRMGELGRQKILSEWNYEKQFEPVLKILEYSQI